MQTLLLLLTLVVEVGCTTPAKLVTCEASASVLGDPAHVTCYFNEVLNDPNVDITVVHHPSGALIDNLGKDVLVCFRSGNSDKPYCITRDGYSFNGSISDVLTLEIPKVTPECAGEYACHVIPPDGFVVHSCNLSVQDSAVTHTDTKDYGNGPTDGDGSPCAQTDGCYATTTALTAALVCAAMLLIIAAIVIVHFRRRLCKRNAYVETQPEEADKDPQSAEPFIQLKNSQLQSSFFSNIWSCFAKLLRVRRTTDDTKDKNKDATILRSMALLTTSDEDLMKEKQSVPGNIFERNIILEDQAKASQTELTGTERTQATHAIQKDTKLVAQPEESRKDR